jgi:cell division septum initiation protein DivIVA
MNIFLKNKKVLDESDIASYVSDMADRIEELERENEMLREQITDLRLGVA